MSIDASRGGTLRYPRVGAGDSLCGRGGVDAREASRRGVGFLCFRHGERYVQLGGEDDRVQGVVMVYSRATRGAGIVIHVIPSVVVNTGPYREGSFMWFPSSCDSTMRWCTGTSAGALLRAGPRGRDLIQCPGRPPDTARRRSVYRPSPKPEGTVLSTYDPR